MAEASNDIKWDLLLKRIKAGLCTPFIGAGACAGVLPLGSTIAKDWAQEHNYPLQKSADDLARVAQFLALKEDPMFPKDKILECFEGVEPPNYMAAGQPHGVLADLPLPLYITTNYDDFMYEALRSRNKEPKRMLCRWHKEIKQPSSSVQRDFEWRENPNATIANPIVFHLHGHQRFRKSLVLTEDDYLDFLVNLSRERDQMLPARIHESLTNGSLLFVGYALADWDFRVIFRGLVTAMESGLRDLSIAVQLLPVSETASDYERKQVQDYLNILRPRKNANLLIGVIIGVTSLGSRLLNLISMGNAVSRRCQTFNYLSLRLRLPC